MIRRAVSKDPAERHRSAGELIAAAREGAGSEVRPTAVLSRDAGERTTVPTGFARFGLGPLHGPALAWAGAGAAILAAIVVLVLLGGGGVDVSAPIAIGRAPLRVAAGSEAIWVTSERDGTLTRLDPESGEIVGRPIPLGAGVSGVAVGGRWVWVTNSRRGELLRIDPRSGRVLKTIDLGGAPGPIALGGGRVWVADEGGRGVTAVNAEGGRVYRRGLPPHAAPLRLAVGARRSLGLQRLDRQRSPHRPRQPGNW